MHGKKRQSKTTSRPLGRNILSISWSRPFVPSSLYENGTAASRRPRRRPQHIAAGPPLEGRRVGGQPRDLSGRMQKFAVKYAGIRSVTMRLSEVIGVVINPAAGSGGVPRFRTSYVVT